MSIFDKILASSHRSESALRINLSQNFGHLFIFDYFFLKIIR